MSTKNRKSIRLKDFDYSTAGLYFVTICSKNRENIFSEIDEEFNIKLTEIGKIIKNCWLEIPSHFKNIKLDECVIMPNHFHGIIGILKDENLVGNNDRCSLHRNMDYLPKIISQFKSSVSGIIKKELNYFSPIWQKSFYEHIIRNEKDLEKIRNYILQNPENWDLDLENQQIITRNNDKFF